MSLADDWQADRTFERRLHGILNDGLGRTGGPDDGYRGIQRAYDLCTEAKEPFMELKTEELDRVIEEYRVRGVVEPLRQLAMNAPGGYSLELIIKLALLYGIHAGAAGVYKHPFAERMGGPSGKITE